VTTGLRNLKKLSTSCDAYFEKYIDTNIGAIL
jgi:hypothetical protein